MYTYYMYNEIEYTIVHNNKCSVCVCVGGGGVWGGVLLVYNSVCFTDDVRVM